MKRILYLTFYFRPDLCAGSFRNSPLVDELAQQVGDRNIEVVVITTSTNRYATYRKEFKEKETLGNVTIERVVVPPHKSGVRDQILSFKTYFFEVLKRTKSRKYDLVFASSSRFFTSYLAYLIAKRNRAALYLDIRDLFSETVKNISDNPLIKYLVAPVTANREKKVYQYATHINLISEGFQEDFKKYKKTTFSFFTHGVDPVFQINQEKNGQPGTGNPKRILYAGNIGEGQGLHKIIPDAANQLKERYLFRVIGDGGAKGKLTDRLKQLNVLNVELTDPINRKEVVEEYKNADILFIHLNDLPIFQKVLPSKVFELAAVEKPILAGVNGYAREFLNNKVDGVFLFDPGDVEGLINQIQRIEQIEELNLSIDNGDFFKQYSRQQINKQLASSILSYL